MKTTTIGPSPQQAPRIIIGCMRINEMTNKDLETLINTAVEAGYNMFDHADIYGGNGKCEQLFGNALKAMPIKREDIILQSKCGICKESPTAKWYDFSKEHIIKQVEQSLQNLHTDYLDVLLLHRPDILADPEVVAETFEILNKSGKVKHFGFSNATAQLFDFFQSYIEQPLVANQVQMGLGHTYAIDSLMYSNSIRMEATQKDGNILLNAKQNKINIQAWSPFQYGMFEGIFIDHPKFPKLNEVLDHWARLYNVDKSGIATAWLLRLDPKLQVITGTTKPERLKKIFAGNEINLNRKEWYSLYFSEHVPL
ncbi:MAG: aldo/keto reductase [Bacteroidales bacterium]|jgi:predicted oxidoreductase|nr:aldo/keto reductase [Bacteroidales bacterium]